MVADKVADMVADMVADVVADMVAKKIYIDININMEIQFEERDGHEGWLLGPNFFYPKLARLAHLPYYNITEV